jgi:nitric oxide reductase NorE protein
MTGVATGAASTGDPVTQPVRRRAPGEPAAWVLLLGDMTLFALLFTVYMHDRHDQPMLFALAQGSLSKSLGLLNTVVLLASSVFVVFGSQHLKAGRRTPGRAWLSGAICCGLVFVAVKAVEWSSAVSQGHALTSDLFYTMYFALTGIHLAHVVVGIGALYALARARGDQLSTPRAAAYADTGACFWHMVDLIWLVLFPLLYLVR